MALYYVGITQNVIFPGFDQNLVLGPRWIGVALFSVLMLLVIVGTTNTVNLTDGLDGLAAGAGGIALLAYTAIAFLERQYDVAIICGAMVGAIVGFLWYNAHPAQVFMGDTGSLAIGGVLAAAAILTKTEMLLPIIGGIFVVRGSRSSFSTQSLGSPDGSDESSRWLLSTTTSRCRAGRRTRWWCDSGSFSSPLPSSGLSSTTSPSTTTPYEGHCLRTLVYGLGESGVAAAQALMARDEEVLVADSEDSERTRGVVARLGAEGRLNAGAEVLEAV